MKTMFLAAIGMATVIASPAFAQAYDPDLGSGNVGRPQTAPWSAYQGAEGSFARVNPGTTRLQAPNAVYDERGQVIGADPDPNVRLQLQKDHDAIQ